MDSDDRARMGRNYRHFSRRKFIAGAAGLSAGAVVGGQLPTVAHAAETGGLHGAELRGMYLTSNNRLAEGRFGTMFKKLPAFAPPDNLLEDLATMMVEGDTGDAFLAKNRPEPTPVRWVHVHWAVHRPRHHVGHHAAR
jgi:hypothetical protein